MLEFYPAFPLNPNLNQTGVYTVQKGFGLHEVNKIVRLVKEYEYSDALIMNDDDVTKIGDIRKSKIKWLPPEAEKTEWIYERLMGIALDVNYEYWKFNLHHVQDSIQYTEYEADYSGHYDWHMDLGPYPVSHRKISMIVQLSDPNDYEGGEVEINNGNFDQPFVASKFKGDVTVFPSYLTHRVKPLTNGFRKSLVLWVGGATFR
jgi:PKHD-type hydroxylase